MGWKRGGGNLNERRKSLRGKKGRGKRGRKSQNFKRDSGLDTRAVVKREWKSRKSFFGKGGGERGREKTVTREKKTHKSAVRDTNWGSRRGGSHRTEKIPNKN